MVLLPVLGATLGLAFALILSILVFPKLDSVCTLPMPPLRSYFLGHAAEFVHVAHIRSTFMRWFQEFGDIFQIWIVHRRVVITSHPTDVTLILAKSDIFARPPAQTSLFNDLQPDNFQTMQRSVHRLHRLRIRDAFSDKTVSAYSSVVSKAVQSLINRLTTMKHAKINLTPHLADTTFQVLLEAVLGSSVSPSERVCFQHSSKAFLTQLFIEYCTYPLRRIFAFLGVRRHLFRQHKLVKQFATKLIENRENETEEERAKRAFDVLDVIQELNPSNRSQQVSNIAMFAIAGFESSSEAIAWAIYEISGHPEVVTKIQNEVEEVMGDAETITYEHAQRMKYLTQCWQETLRLHPTAGFLLRVTTRDVTLPGTQVNIPKGVQVGALIAASQRHPKFVTSHPDEFRPERWSNSDARLEQAFVPFSCGPERCPGRALANFECVVILASLYRKFDISLACRREEVRGISDWTERARTKAAGVPDDEYSWSLPVRLSLRTKAN